MKRWLQLGRASNLPTVWSNTIVGWCLGGGGWDIRLLGLLIGGSLIYMAGCTLNDYADASWDQEHRPERPIPSGQMSRQQVGQLAVNEFTLALVFFGLVPVAIWPLLGLIGMILLYTWSHKKTAWAVIPMALCRVFLGWMAYGTAIGEQSFTIESLSHGPILSWSVAIAAWIIMVTATARLEAKKTPSIPPSLVTWGLGLLVIVSLAIMAQVHLWPLVALAGVGLWLIKGQQLLHSPQPSRIGLAVGHWLAGLPLLDTVIFATLLGEPGILLALATPAAQLWQKRVAAT